MTILHVLAPSAHGGAETVVRLLATGLAERGHRVHLGLILGKDQSEHPLERELKGGSVAVTAWRLSPRAYAEERRLLARLCERMTPSVIHTHGYRADVNGWRSVGRRFSLVSTAHGFTRGDLKNRVYEWMQRQTYRRFQAVVAVSDAIAEQLKRSGVPGDRIHLVPNACLPSTELLERGEARARMGIDPEAFLVGWVGRLSAEKGVDVFLDAIPLLSDLKMGYAIVGDGPERSLLEERLGEGEGREDVRWTGGLQGASKLFGAFDLFVLSSRTEGTPMVLLEAMAAGVPIITTRVGGVPDLVSEQEAILVRPSDPTALAAGIRAAFDDMEKSGQRVLAARRRLTTAFDADAWLGAYETVYQTAVEARGSRGIQEQTGP
jgi:glycosyltransferase involved in cell wall biosynthesis